MRTFSFALLILGWLSFHLAACSPISRPEVPAPTESVSILPTDTTTLLPDLAVGEISLEVDDLSCEASQQTWVISTRVYNIGQVRADPFWVQVHGPGYAARSYQVEQGLPAGESTFLQFFVSVPAVTLFSTEVVVDVFSQINESNRENNRASRSHEITTQSVLCTPTPVFIFPGASPEVVMSGHEGAIYQVAFSPDGRLAASGSVDNTLRLWRVNPGDLLRTMYGHPFPVRSLAFSPDGAMLATGSTDGVLRIWRVSDGSLLRAIHGHAGWMPDLVFSPDGRFLVSTAQDFTVRLWRVSNWSLVQLVDEGLAQINRVVFSPNSQSFAWGESDGTVRIRSIGGAWVQIFKASSLAAGGLAFAPDGSRLVAGFADGSIRIWDVSSGDIMQVLKSHTQSINDLAISKDGRWLVTAGQDGALHLWHTAEDSENGAFETQPRLVLLGHTGQVASVAISQSRGWIVSGGEDGNVYLWKLPEP